MENPKVQEVIEKQILTVTKAVEDMIDDEISMLDHLDTNDLEALRERRLQQMKKMAEKMSRWISLGHGEYSEITSEKDFLSVFKASDRVICHSYRENWPSKVKVNKLTSTKTQLPYSYYTLPYCHPENIVDSAENLGEVLRGDRSENSPYVFKMKEPQMCKVLCRIVLDKKTSKALQEKIDDEYRVNI